MGNYNCTASKEAPSSNAPVVVTTKSGAAVAKDSNLKPGQNTLLRYLQQNHDSIFASNRKSIDARLADDPQFFEKLSSGQHPDYL
jgi:carbonic anhydrase